jgi:hypothetical protein
MKRSQGRTRLSLRERIVATVNRRLGTQIFAGAPAVDGGMPHGCFTVKHSRGGRVINEWTIPNLITNEGKNHILNVQFHGTTPITTWYLGLIDEAGFTAVAVADNYDNINQVGNGWDEFDDYTDRNNADSAVTRPVWNENAASGQAIANTTLAIYDFTSTGTVHGLFVAGGASAATKGDNTAGTGHKLWAATPFTDPIDVTNGDDLSVSYTVAW